MAGADAELRELNLAMEAGAAPAVRYTVRIETDARPQQAQALLDKYLLRAMLKDSA